MIVTVVCVEHVHVEAVLENNRKRPSACCIGTPLLLPRILRAISCCLTDSPLMLLLLHCICMPSNPSRPNPPNAIFNIIFRLIWSYFTTSPSSKQCAVLKIFLLQDEQREKACMGRAIILCGMAQPAS